MKNDGLKVTFSLSPPFIPLLVVFLIHLLEKADNKLYAIWAINFMSHRAHQSSESGIVVLFHIYIDCCCFKGLLCPSCCCCLGCVNEWRNRYVSTNKAREILQQAILSERAELEIKEGYVTIIWAIFQQPFTFPPPIRLSFYSAANLHTHTHCCCKNKKI